jgi:hypothetical protein
MRLLGYFDNSLFKMIKDWVPGRASLASGVIIRPHILERVKMKRFEPDFYTGSYYTGSIPMVDITASYGYQEDRITFDYDYTTAAPNVPTTNSVASTFTTASGIYIYNVNEDEIINFRKLLKKILSDKNKFLVANFDGKILGAKTNGHISPIVAYNQDSDEILILDVALHKNQWYWVNISDLLKAMNTKDGENYRGYAILYK